MNQMSEAEKTSCPCGGKFLIKNKKQHETTKMHREWVEKGNSASPLIPVTVAGMTTDHVFKTDEKKVEEKPKKKVIIEEESEDEDVEDEVDDGQGDDDDDPEPQPTGNPVIDTVKHEAWIIRKGMAQMYDLLEEIGERLGIGADEDEKES